jgi:hypothetical protein
MAKKLQETPPQRSATPPSAMLYVSNRQVNDGRTAIRCKNADRKTVFFCSGTPQSSPSLFLHFTTRHPAITRKPNDSLPSDDDPSPGKTTDQPFNPQRGRILESTQQAHRHDGSWKRSRSPKVSLKHDTRISTPLWQRGNQMVYRRRTVSVQGD